MLTLPLLYMSLVSARKYFALFSYPPTGNQGQSANRCLCFARLRSAIYEQNQSVDTRYKVDSITKSLIKRKCKKPPGATQTMEDGGGSNLAMSHLMAIE